MKTPSCLAPLVFALVLSSGVIASEATDAQEILKLAARPPAAPAAKRSDMMRADDQAAQQFRERALAFLAAHPSGVERARIVLALNTRQPNFIKEFKAGFDEKPSAELVVYDTAARDAWEKQLSALLRGVRDDAKAGRPQQQEAAFALLNSEVYEGKSLADFTALQREIDAFAASGGTAARVRSLQSGLFYAAASLGVPTFEKLLEQIARGGNAVAAQAAQETRDTLAQQKANIAKIKFTAADGREVDINALRGKVVLVDFWATWCGPCIREIPNVVANYQKYHAKGFEIVGMAFENPGIIDEAALRRTRPGAPAPAIDTPEQVAEKMTKAKQKMLAFAAGKGMAWPQHFDGKYWQNEFGVLFGIRAIPAMFLLDQDGNIVSTNARGENLEPALQRLLRL
jgi:thiol-disulfide isomerase/thioredoxin